MTVSVFSTINKRKFFFPLIFKNVLAVKFKMNYLTNTFLQSLDSRSIFCNRPKESWQCSFIKQSSVSLPCRKTEKCSCDCTPLSYIEISQGWNPQTVRGFLLYVATDAKWLFVIFYVCLKKCWEKGESGKVAQLLWQLSLRQTTIEGRPQPSFEMMSVA